jgi:uncharacterized protein
MDVENAIRAFSSGSHDLPREAMRWALENWDEAAPGLLAVVERFADGTDRSDDAANAAFFILHLAAERREGRVFAPLCRLIQDGEAIEAALGDGITTTLRGILIGTYDGDPAALRSAIEAVEADEFARAAALEALAWLTATGEIDRAATEAYLLRLHGTLQPQRANFVWIGWQSAVALLGLEALADVVRRAFRRGLIDRTWMTYGHFREDLPCTLADPERLAGFRHDRIAPLDDAIGELSGWHGFSAAAKEESERRSLAFDAAARPDESPPPAVNPFKGVGRNDPCPCGSGRKFKRGCLPLMSP